MKRYALALVAIAAVISAASAERLAIGQVDTTRLLLGQRVDLYLSIEAGAGVTPTVDDLSVTESPDGLHFSDPRPLIALEPVRSLDAPLSFMMLVDNSGSMYDETVPDDPGVRRIDAARAAIRDFANGITNSRDRIGLAVFNTRYVQVASPSADKAKLGGLLDSIVKPARAEGYTELYAALAAAASDAASVGRRTVIVLSDGENYPYSIYEHEDSPVYGSRLFAYTDAIDAFQREGLSLFAIHYGSREDPNLDDVALATGGAVYRASGAEALAGVYRDIRERLLSEYRLSYRASMLPGERRFVRVEYRGVASSLQATRPYFSNTLFASADGANPILMLIALVLGLLVLALLLVVRARAGRTGSSLVVIDSGGAHGLEKTVALGNDVTVIGASVDADVTIAGVPAVNERHAVIAYEPKRSEYTIVSDAPVRVNNKAVTKRVLKPGDIINIEGTVFAYDRPEDEKDDSTSGGT